MYLQHALTDPNMVQYDSNTNPPMQKKLSENLCPLKPRQIFGVKSLKGLCIALSLIPGLYKLCNQKGPSSENAS